MLRLAGLLVIAQAATSTGERFGDRLAQDVLAYDLDLEVALEERRLTGEARITIRANQPLEEVRLDARRSSTYSVSCRDEDGDEIAARWEGEVAVLPLGRRVEPGATVEVHALLDGQPPDGFHFTETTHGDPIAFTDHYSIRAHAWLPCEDNPADRASFTVALAWTGAGVAIASGAPIEAEYARAGLMHRTQSDIPPYMLTIVLGPFERVAEEGDARIWPHYVYRADVEAARHALTRHAEWVALLEKAVGPYAYEKYTTVQCPTRWGGFEAPGNVLLSENAFDDPRETPGLLAHELAHMWFGDAVGYAEWRDVWLSEGFASYFGPWLLSRTGGPAFIEALRQMRESWLRAPEGREKSVRWSGFDHPDRALNANTYPKGAWVLHMLSLELGEAGFFAALREYYTSHRGQSVTTADFVASVEKSSGRDLDWFFTQWLDRAGCPALRFTREGEGLLVEQQGDDPPWRFPLRVAWIDDQGQRISRVFPIDERREQLDLPNALGGMPEIDPDVELLYRRVR